MDVPSSSLPDDPAELKRLVADQQQTIKQQSDQLTHQSDQLVQRSKQLTQAQSLIDILEDKIRSLQAQHFGKKSERYLNQYHLFNEAELAALADASVQAQDDSTVEVPAHKRRRQGSRALPEDLVRVDVVHDLPEQDKRCTCGNTLQPIGEDVHEQLCVIPQQYYVLRHRKVKYGCQCKACMKSAMMPKQPIPGSQASPAMLAYIMVSKFLNGLPLYRLEQMAKREGLDLPRAKLARWMIQGSAVFTPIINYCVDALFSHDICWSDDTRIQVLKESGRSPENQSALWIRRGGPPDKPVVLIDYAVSKSGETAYQLLSEFNGYLVCDGATNFNLVVNKNQLTPVLCNDHARRYFDKVVKTIGKQKSRGSIALTALSYYGKLYRLEKQIATLTPQEKNQARQQQALPLWASFIEWAKTKLAEGVRHAGTQKALKYLINHETGLQQYCNDGRLPISNIKAEHVAKTIAIARKNFLFADTPAGAEASARVFSMIETAKANGHNPMHYLTMLLAELPNANTVQQIEALLPWSVTPEQAKAYYQALPSP